MASKELSTILKFSFGIAPRKVEYGDIKQARGFMHRQAGYIRLIYILYQQCRRL